MVQADGGTQHGPSQKALHLVLRHRGSLDTLESLGWDGKSVAAIGLELTPDNRRVKRSQFLLLGALSREPVGLAANKLFPDADPAITMTIPSRRVPRFASTAAPCPVTSCRASRSNISSPRPGTSFSPPTGGRTKSARHPCELSVIWTKLQTPGPGRNRRRPSSSS